MRTFRITLSHGDEHITFDGAGARSGSMFHVRRDAIEGLWSSPASKVSLTERETANGASPISDGETLYAARTVVIPFAIQSNYNHTDLLRARTLLGRLIGWHDVRMDINDDCDETVLYGYIEAKYSDIPYDHADAGVITVVCPDPRRISKHGSTISMNTSSSGLGGLSFGASNAGLAFPLDFGQTGNAGTTGMIENNGSYVSMPTITAHGWLDNGLTIHWNTSDGNEGDLSFNGNVGNVPVTINTDTHSAIMGGLDVSYLLGSRDWPRIPAGGSCSFALLASGSGWVSVQSHDTYM